MKYVILIIAFFLLSNPDLFSQDSSTSYIDSSSKYLFKEIKKIDSVINQINLIKNFKEEKIRGELSGIGIFEGNIQMTEKKEIKKLTISFENIFYLQVTAYLSFGKAIKINFENEDFYCIDNFYFNKNLQMEYSTEKINRINAYQECIKFVNILFPTH